MRVLGLTTSTPRGGAAVCVDGAITGASGYVDLQNHAERIFEAIDRALAEAGLGRGDIDALACDVGPGSFTGVRVGVASIKGIALALGVPILGVGSLEAMAEAAFADGSISSNDLVFAAIDAKKNELFAAIYDSTLATVVSPTLLGRDEAAAAVLEASLGVGGRRARRIGEWPGASSPELPNARSVARIGAARFAATGERPEVEAVYVRPPDAKLPST